MQQQNSSNKKRDQKLKSFWPPSMNCPHTYKNDFLINNDLFTSSWPKEEQDKPQLWNLKRAFRIYISEHSFLKKSAAIFYWMKKHWRFVFHFWVVSTQRFEIFLCMIGTKDMVKNIMFLRVYSFWSVIPRRYECFTWILY